MRRALSFVGAVTIALSTAALSACRSTPPPAPSPTAPPAASSSSPPAAAPSLDVTRARPLLSHPALLEVQQAEAAQDYLVAAQRLERALAERPPEADERPRWLYQLGRLYGLAKRHAEARVAFSGAAEASWPLSPYAAFGAAQEAGRAGLHDEAIRLSSRVGDELPVGPAARLVEADAREAKGDLAGALALLVRYLAGPKGGRHAEIGLRAARLELALARDDEGALRALKLARRVAVEHAASAAAAKAVEVERDALSKLSAGKRAEVAERSHDDEVARLTSLFEAGKLAGEAKALAALDAALGEAERKGELGCRVALLSARLASKTAGKGKSKDDAAKARREAADAFEAPIARCQGDLKAQALFHGGSASASINRHADALARFERLEREVPSHRLADDARLKGAAAALAMGDEARFSQLLERIAEVYPEGDMVAEGLFRLALHRISKGDWAGAVAPLEASIKARPRERDYASAGRAPYFHARALLATGDRERARAELSGIIRDYPLTYYMALAHGRLADLDAAAARDAVEQAKSREPATTIALPDHPALRSPGLDRAIELLRQGEVDLARSELSALAMLGAQASSELQWVSAMLLREAGALVAAHNIPRGRVTDWLDHYPVGSARALWEIAYPRPWLDVVSREAQKSGILPSLAYAIMREESAFDPVVVSSAQAYGLMQFTMPTAQTIGKKLGLAVSEPALKTPAVSVALGCRYLADLRRDFAACPPLAIPSYNAGPNKTRRWVKERPFDDLDVFVERIPYDETRNYTKRVIKSYAAYLFLYEPDQLAEALRMPQHVRGRAEPEKAEPEPSDEPATE